MSRKISFCLLLVILLAACQPAAQVTVNPPVTSSPPPPSPAPTRATPAAPLPTRVTIGLPAIGSGALVTPTATPTLTPAPTVTATRLAGRAGERTIHDPYIPQLGNTGYDVQRYILRMTLDPARGPLVNARVTVQALAMLDELVEFSLDFAGFEIQGLLLDGRPVDYERRSKKLIVYADQPLSSGQPFELEVRYQGLAPSEPSPYIPFVQHVGLFHSAETETLFVLAEPDGARNWFPCNDHPRDKAAFRFELAVPEELTAAANGRLLERRTELPNLMPDGRAGDLFIWEHNGPMATYLATVVVGDYALIEGRSPGGVPLRTYAFPASREAFADTTALVGEMVDWMSERLGPYPFEVFGYAQIDPVGAALETQTLVLIAEPEESTMAHELAHMWFGDSVSLDSWGDIWRNEGFATYFAALWMTRNDPSGMQAVVSQWQRYPNVGPPLLDPPPRDMFDLNSYWGGALVVYRLHQEMGDEAFFGGLRAYFERYGGGTATLEQFVAEMEAAAGRPLEAFFVRELVGE